MECLNYTVATAAAAAKYSMNVLSIFTVFKHFAGYTVHRVSFESMSKAVM